MPEQRSYSLLCSLCKLLTEAIVQGDLLAAQAVNDCIGQTIQFERRRQEEPDHG